LKLTDDSFTRTHILSCYAASLRSVGMEIRLDGDSRRLD